jgi:hypothetical protein
MKTYEGVDARLHALKTLALGEVYSLGSHFSLFDEKRASVPTRQEAGRSSGGLVVVAKSEIFALTGNLTSVPAHSRSPHKLQCRRSYFAAGPDSFSVGSILNFT